MGLDTPVFYGDIMKKEYGYFDMLLEYRRASLKRGVVPTKVYLTMEQICALECECTFRCISIGPSFLDNTIFGMHIVNVDTEL